jgi:hypothetical protein
MPELEDALFDEELPPQATATATAPRPARSPSAWRRLRRSGGLAMPECNETKLASG